MSSKQRAVLSVEQLEQRLVGHTVEDDDDGVYVGRGYDGEAMGDVEIGERGWLGNPFAMSDGYSRQEAVERFEEALVERIEADAEFRAALRELAGQRLDCWCQHRGECGDDCHGTVIAKHAMFLASHTMEEDDE